MSAAELAQRVVRLEVELEHTEAQREQILARLDRIEVELAAVRARMGQLSIVIVGMSAGANQLLTWITGGL